MIHTKWEFVCVLAVTVIFSSLPAIAEDDCHDLNGDAAIAACTRDIKSGKWKGGHDLAIKYYNRGTEFDEKGDDDRAISDYNQAISLDPKYASAYNNRGNAYKNKGNYDRAIADYNEAIRLDPKYALAYRNRGNAYKDKHDYDRAVADYTEAIRLNPQDAKAYARRGVAYRDKGDNDRAIADFSEAIGLDPRNDAHYARRGRAYLYSGDPAKAFADMNYAAELDPKDAYNALWLDIIGHRGAIPSRLSAAVSKIDMATWPGPVIRLFLGQLTPAALLAAADDPDPAKKRDKLCEANFYSGEMALRQQAKDEATRLFRVAGSDDCKKVDPEWRAAHAELRALGVNP
jgi:lipoprotein NlpI